MEAVRQLRAVRAVDRHAPQRGRAHGWDEVDGGDWLIPAARYKTKADHLIPLSRAARAVLAKMPVIAGCDYVFTGDGKHAIAGFSRLKAKLDKAAGVTG